MESTQITTQLEIVKPIISSKTGSAEEVDTQAIIDDMPSVTPYQPREYHPAEDTTVLSIDDNGLSTSIDSTLPSLPSTPIPITGPRAKENSGNDSCSTPLRRPPADLALRVREMAESRMRRRIVASRDPAPRLRTRSCPLTVIPLDMPKSPVLVRSPRHADFSPASQKMNTMKRTRDASGGSDDNYIGRGRRVLLETLLAKDHYANSVRTEFYLTQYFAQSDAPLQDQSDFRQVQTLIRLAVLRKYNIFQLLITNPFEGIEGLTAAMQHVRHTGAGVRNICGAARHAKCKIHIQVPIH